jgi:hypothetical protein
MFSLAAGFTPTGWVEAHREGEVPESFGRPSLNTPNF